MFGNDLRALFYTLQNIDLSFQAGCVINASYAPDMLDFLPPEKTDIISASYQVHHMFKEQGYLCAHTIPEETLYALCCVLLPKQKDQALYDIACALMHLQDDGTLIVCAGKESGGMRLVKMLQAFGLEVSETFSKYHCKSVVAIKKNTVKNEHINQCLKKGGMQINKHGYHVKAGVFGWNKIDVGSECLSQYMPDNIKGRGADFGCGYGYLTDQIFVKNKHVTHMSCVDIDIHAVHACQKNLEHRHSSRSFETIWSDASRYSYTSPLDFIVMNPPFHAGKNQDIGLGQSMIDAAHRSLRPEGILYMVANTHLPYERRLRDLFPIVECVAQEKGFKIFFASK